jgi:hypothetical protein
MLRRRFGGPGLGRSAVRFGQEVDDQRPRRLLGDRRQLAEGEQHQEQQEIDAERQREPRRAPPERRPII